jgi:carboxyl-terminal processing protease
MLQPRAAAVLIATLFVSGCGKTITPEEQETRANAQIAKELAFTSDPLAPDEYLPIQTDEVFHPNMRGIWKARGYGYVFEVSENQLHWYSHTTHQSWEHTPDEPLDMMFAVQQPSGRRYIKPYPTESAYILEPLDALPARFTEPPAAGPSATLDRIDETMSELYPFFEARQFDWLQRMAAARSAINDDTTESELFAVVERLFEGLDDGHTSVSAEIDGESRTTSDAMSSIRAALEADFASKQETIERADYFGGWSDRLFAGIKDRLLHGEGKTAFGENIMWGKVTPQGGYLLVRGMANFGDDDQLVDGLKRLHQQLRRIFASFAECEAVIIDVSFNMGGYHSYAMAFASHIADRERYALCKYPQGHPDLLQKFHVVPYCDKRGTVQTFTKPVYVVTTDATVSAGEEFVLAARAFPHVKIVGVPTQGMLSDILEKPLPNGWTLGMSNEIFLDHLGQCHEVTGIPVDIEKQIFNIEEISQIGHADAILELAQEIVAE